MSSEARVIEASYGFRRRARAEVRAALERALGITFEASESSYLGEYECYPPIPAPDAIGEDEVSLRLRDNLDPLDGLPARADYPDVTVLLEVSSRHADRVDELDTLLRGALGAQRI